MNVYEAAMQRIKIAFKDFDNVLVAFSCGKDSGVVLNLAYKYAVETGHQDKLAFYYEDYEANYQHTHDYADRAFKEIDVPRKYWLCLPISAACSVSMYEPRWIPWDPAKQDIWVRKMPKYDYVVNYDNCPYPFIIGTKGFDARLQFADWFSKKYGRTAVLIGLRADESLTRRAIFTSQHRKLMHRDLSYTKIIDKLTVNFYPIYDWRAHDIWVCNAKFAFDYNKAYDLFYQAGLTIDQMRIASPFHQSGQENLKLYRVIDPHSWGKMIGRVNGCNFGGIYGGTSAMGWKNITKPAHFTWKQYAEFLMSTLPEATKKNFIYHLKRFQDSWENEGYGRNPRVIKAMIEQELQLVAYNRVLKADKFGIVHTKTFVETIVDITPEKFKLYERVLGGLYNVWMAKKLIDE